MYDRKQSLVCACKGVIRLSVVFWLIMTSVSRAKIIICSSTAADGDQMSSFAAISRVLTKSDYLVVMKDDSYLSAGNCTAEITHRTDEIASSLLTNEASSAY